MRGILIDGTELSSTELRFEMGIALCPTDGHRWPQVQAHRYGIFYPPMVITLLATGTSSVISFFSPFFFFLNIFSPFFGTPHSRANVKKWCHLLLPFNANLEKHCVSISASQPGSEFGTLQDVAWRVRAGHGPITIPKKSAVKRIYFHMKFGELI